MNFARSIDDELATSHEWDLSADDVIEAMTARALLVHDSSASPARWRTRNGETIRLVARLRQTFLGQTWQSGTNLISDFRYARRPRFYPKRDHPWNTVSTGSTAPPTRIAGSSRS